MTKYALSFLLVFAVACGKDDGHDHDHGCGGGAHDHSAKHGGTVSVLGDHAGHLEVKVDHDATTITIWISDNDRKDMNLDEAPVLTYMSMGDPAEVKGKGGPSKWVFKHDDFAGDVENAKFRLKMGGNTFSPKMAHDHAHDHDKGDGHDHDGEGCGHDDDKDHDHDHDKEKGHDHDHDHDHDHKDGDKDG